MLLRRPVPALVAAPTAAAGQVDPAVLLTRLERAAAEGWQPGEYDLQQALLRLPRDIDPTLATRAHGLDSPAGRRLTAWLDRGGLPDPAVRRVAVTVPRRSDDFRARPRNYRKTVVQVAVTPASTTGQATGCASLADLLVDLPAPEPNPLHRQVSPAVWISCWPAVLPAHRDVIAAHLVAQLADTAQYAAVALPLLAEADGPAGPGLALALAYGIGASDPTHRAAAVDATLTLAARDQFDGDTVGAELAALVALDAVKLTHPTAALRDMAAAGADRHAWAVLAASLPSLLTDKPPARLADLLALAVEIAERRASRATIPELAAVAARRSVSRTITEARRLHRLLTEDDR